MKSLGIADKNEKFTHEIGRSLPVFVSSFLLNR